MIGFCGSTLLILVPAVLRRHCRVPALLAGLSLSPGLALKPLLSQDFVNSRAWGKKNLILCSSTEVEGRSINHKNPNIIWKKHVFIILLKKRLKMQFLYASRQQFHTCQTLEHMKILNTSNRQYSSFSHLLYIAVDRAAWSLCALSLPGSLCPELAQILGKRALLGNPAQGPLLCWFAGCKILSFGRKISRPELHPPTGTEQLHKHAPVVDRHLLRLLFQRMISAL